MAPVCCLTCAAHPGFSSTLMKSRRIARHTALSTGVDHSPQPISNTGPIAGNTNSVKVYAVVTIPAGAPTNNIELFFQALSPTSGAQDILHAEQNISPVYAITIGPNQNGQVTPGGVVIYTHQVCNQGNVATAVTLTTSNSLGTWSAVLYSDANGSGAFSTNDTPILSALTVAAGSCTTVFVKVSSPSGATVGNFDTTAITGTSSAPTATANDGTTVIASDLLLTKLQAIDLNCTGSLLPASAFTNATLAAPPGACIQYKIIVQNNGTTTNQSVVVYDAMPPYTSYQNPPQASYIVGGGSVQTVTPSGGALTFSLGTLVPGNVGTCTFVIKISP